MKSHNNTLNAIMEVMNAHKILILSTSIDNVPHSRPIGSFRLISGSIYFSMNNDKPLFAQLKANPQICICACGADYAWVRIYARAKVSHNQNIKAFYINEGLTRFKDINDMRFSVIKLSHIRAEIHKMGQIETLEA